MPADWFPAETHGLLAAYCRHHENGQRLAALVDGFNLDAVRNPDGPGLRVYDKLLAAHQRETAAMSSLATRLRMTPQSRMRAETAARYGRVVDVDVSSLWGGDETNDMAQLKGPEKAP
jgi:hypothetical protein